MTDIEIAQKTKLKEINLIAKKLGLSKNNLIHYGRNIAKIDNLTLKPKGNLILVTSINPTTAGEGKTTLSIGLADALSLLGKSVCLALREPSLGPVFGIKGGATGGGYSQIVPMKEINLHFTGDFHAITSANNLLSAMIDNHIFQGNSLNIDENNIKFHRCVDINDRALREITIAQDGLRASVERKESFSITSASEIMAILCLSKDLVDLKKRLGNIVVAFSKAGKPIYAKDLQAENAMTILLQQAIKPNLVQTLTSTPALIHGGPFANIAHGCNSILATLSALTYADYAVTEAGFGADLGGEKFIDIKSREANLNAKVVVIVVTVRALKLHGGCDKQNLLTPNVTQVKKGICILEKHIENLKNVFNKRIICAINKFDNDCEEEIEVIKNSCKKYKVDAFVATPHQNGGKGCTDLAQAVIKECDKKSLPQKYAYNLNDNIITKTRDICKRVYGAKDIRLSDKAKESLKTIEPFAKDFYVCIAKSQYSLSDNPTLIGRPKNFIVEIKDFELRSGANMVVALAGNIMLMPGLSKVPAACNMHIDKNGSIKGLF